MSIVAAIDAWRSELAALPVNHPRRWGAFLLSLGSVAMLLTMLLTPPWASIGLATAIVGAALARAPFRHALRLPWVLCGLAYGLWIVTSCVIARTQGLDGSRLAPPGAAWTWLLAPLVALGLSDQRIRARAISVLAVVMTAAATLAVLQFTIGLGDGPLKIDPAGERHAIARGFSEHHLTFGLACALLLVVSAQQQAAWACSRTALWVLRGAATLGLVVCGSRAAVLGAAAGIWATLSVRGRRWAVIGLILVVAGGGALAARFAITQPDRLANTMRLQDGRWPIWRTSIALIGERPMTGWGGQNTFKLAYKDHFDAANPGQIPEFAGAAPHAHNAILALWAEYGLPALVLCAAFWLTALGWLWRRRHVAPAGWQLGIGVAAVALVGGMFEPYATRAVQGAAIHAALGLAMALGLRSDTDPKH